MIKRRAFFICAAIFVMYVMVGLGLPEKMNMKRTALSEQVKTGSMASLAAKTKSKATPVPVEDASIVPASSTAVDLTVTADTKTVPAVAVDIVPITQEDPDREASASPRVKAEGAPRGTSRSGVMHKEPYPAPPTAFVRNGTAAEPSLFIAVPIVCYALKEGLIEKEGLIFIKKQGYNTPDWKKPLDILKDKDEEGLRSISKVIGKNQLNAFLKKEGIIQDRTMSAEDIVLGKGYAVEKKKLLSLYDRHVSNEYKALFPYYIGGVGIGGKSNGFEFFARKVGGIQRKEREDTQWMMPNLTNVTIKSAVEKLSSRTAKIKVHGSGTVTDQDPKPYQKVDGEIVCVLYGRSPR